MDTEASQTTDLYYLAAWAHAKRKRLIAISVAVAIVVVIVGGYFWYQNSRETSASEALSSIQRPVITAATASAPARPYLQLADDYSGTSAAGRALLIAGSIEFDTGKFDDARATFDRFMTQYSSSPMANEAQLGVAASLEAAGKTNEALSRYEDLVKRRMADSTTPQAKAALARLYLAQGKTQLAMQQYEDLVKANNNDPWSAEAGMQLEELLAKFPNLRKPAAAPAIPGSTSSESVPPFK